MNLESLMIIFICTNLILLFKVCILMEEVLNNKKLIISLFCILHKNFEIKGSDILNNYVEYQEKRKDFMEENENDN